MSLALQEIKELQKDPSNDFMAAALEVELYKAHIRFILLTYI